ncbi:uncharacterized protein LOC106087720 [Stomoxys calcitrans]|uniref:uncharacterized protein LOC106087720 n=1 Tax=Stomoxys calcitrans TaxID=35570 RepID=UPI0027E233EE|nr:uncharacterized protein LOC106087720 [Stomoxys calcitrans]
MTGNEHKHLLHGILIVFLVTSLLVENTGASTCVVNCPLGKVVHEETCSCHPQPESVVGCPPGSLYVDKKCRKIQCPSGKFHKGKCLWAYCPPGLVWREGSCQEPGYVTTILEIDNNLVNEIRESPIYLELNKNYNEVHYDSQSQPQQQKPQQQKPQQQKPLQKMPQLKQRLQAQAQAKANLTDQPKALKNSTKTCCTVLTPRVCKSYDDKWICFNRRKHMCDDNVCTKPKVYLSPPELKYQHPILTMPPKLRHDAATQVDDIVQKNNCSGCASNHPENCSAYCYFYFCPPETCTYLDLNFYCSLYPGQFGCIKEHGCLWEWC